MINDCRAILTCIFQCKLFCNNWIFIVHSPSSGAFSRFSCCSSSKNCWNVVAVCFCTTHKMCRAYPVTGTRVPYTFPFQQTNPLFPQLWIFWYFMKYDISGVFLLLFSHCGIQQNCLHILVISTDSLLFVSCEVLGSLSILYSLKIYIHLDTLIYTLTTNIYNIFIYLILN